MNAPLCLAAAVLAVTMAPARADCLDNAAEFADKICMTARTSGKSVLIDGDGKLNSAGRELIAKTLVNLGDNAGAEPRAYEKVLQEQLSAERISLRKCGIAIAKEAIHQTCFKATR